MFNYTRGIIQHIRNNIGKYPLPARVANYSSVPASAELKPTFDADATIAKQPRVVKNSNNIVAAAFASLTNTDVGTQLSDIKTPFTDKRIESATSIDDLLSISANGSGISRRHALKVVSVLAEWSSNGKVQLSDFEADARFIKLCRVLTKNSNYTHKKPEGGAGLNRSEDLSMIMNVAADDEAAKLIASITLPQMVKVMQALALKKRRSTMILRALSHNITKNPNKMDLKQAADLLFSMSVLNFVDANLIEKIAADVLSGFNAGIKKSSVVGSLITSLGILKYKDTSGMLDMLCKWMLDNHKTCRSQDLFAMFLTLGVLNYQPASIADELFGTLLPVLTREEAQKPNIWLDYVWSLVVLNRASKELVDGVLDEAFIAQCDSIPAYIKLLHVNGASEGRKLPWDTSLYDTPVTRVKEKDELVASLLDTLKNLMKSDDYIKSNVNTRMGFLMDAECVIDGKCAPVAVDKYCQQNGHTKIAIMALDYHDMCRGRVEPTGVIDLQRRLLEKKGYTVIQIPFYEYRVRDKLVHRVQLIESKLRAVVSPAKSSSNAT